MTPIQWFVAVNIALPFCIAGFIAGRMLALRVYAEYAARSYILGEQAGYASCRRHLASVRDAKAEVEALAWAVSRTPKERRS